MISALASVGVFVAVPIVGSTVLGRPWFVADRIARVPVVIAAGVAIWSLPLMAALILGIYRPWAFGLLGWLAAAMWYLLRRPALRWQWPRPSAPIVVLLVGLAVASILYAAFPADPVITGRDMGVYAIHATWMAEHGRLDVPYPAGLTFSTLPTGWIGFAGVYSTSPTMTVQFGHLYPAWLAQVFGVAGFDGLIRTNALIAAVSGLAVFSVARRFMTRWVAVVVALVLAFDAGQLWVGRQTLTEILTQLFMWCGFLLLLEPASERHGARLAWAGAFVGMAAMVRIDSLVALPLFLFGLAVAGVLDPDRRGVRRMAPFLVTMIAVSGVATFYYAAFTNPYFTDLGAQLRQIGIASIAAALIYGLSSIGSVRRWTRPILRSTPFLAVAAAGVVALAVFGYFIRPTLEPFRVIDNPGHPLDGTRAYVENTMVNLGAYLAPPTLFLAIAGWIGTTIAAMRNRPILVPFLVVVGAFSALYFWDPMVFPDHFWAIRRYVPIIIPAAVLLAGAAGGFILGRLPRTARPWAFGLVVLALAGYAWRVGTPAYFVAEREGSYRAIEQFSAALSDDQEYLGVLAFGGVRSLSTPLYMSFDEQIVPIDAGTTGGRELLLGRLGEATDQNPIPVVTNIPSDAEALEGDEIARVIHPFKTMAQTFRPVPSQIGESGFGLIAKLVTGLNTLDVEFGMVDSWLASSEGFHGPELVGGEPMRWTMGDAQVTIPVLGDRAADIVVVELQQGAPSGSSLTVEVNGTVVSTDPVANEPMRLEIPMPPLAPGTDARIRLRSDTFVPSETIPGSTDTRTLGVMVRGVSLSSSSP